MYVFFPFFFFLVTLVCVFPGSPLLLLGLQNNKLLTNIIPQDMPHRHLLKSTLLSNKKGHVWINVLCVLLLRDLPDPRVRGFSVLGASYSAYSGFLAIFRSPFVQGP